MVPISLFEKKLFRQLLEYNEKMDLGLIFRVAGGWVRDKVMGKPSDDIDIAIDKMSGAVFSKGFIKYLKNHSEEVYGYHVVAFNHSKAKHLETASLKYSGHSIDFVSLRTEEYTESRIPIVGTGTPQEDAHRRDITINALFYNINTMEIEDYTKRGLLDIQERKIRTPLDPMYTFMDDPLRILRVLRFSARLSFTIVPEILSVLSNKTLHEKLARIVSKERVGQEIRKILGHKGYSTALVTMTRNGLIKAILPTVEITTEEVEGFIRRLEHARKKNICHPVHRVEDIYIVNLFALLQNNRGEKEGKILKTEHAVSEYLKWTRKEKKKIQTIELCILEIEKILNNQSIPEGDKLVQIARQTEDMTEEVLTVYDMLQHSTPEEKRIDITEAYQRIVQEEYNSINTNCYLIDHEEIKKDLNLTLQEVVFYKERYTQLALLHKTRDKDYLLKLLRDEMNHKDTV